MIAFESNSPFTERKKYMNRLCVLFLLAFSLTSFAQKPHIQSGATVYIVPSDGYETYLAAAFEKKQVPVVIVTDKAKADYIITSTVSERAPSSPGVVINNNNGDNGAFAAGWNRGAADHGRTSASINIADAKSSQIVFAYSVGKQANTSQIQSAAEACAKHLKQFIEKQKQ
jgi:sugar/nucleoside kinase (ribokinase family)